LKEEKLERGDVEAERFGEDIVVFDVREVCFVMCFVEMVCRDVSLIRLN
jgi:hypothetical protein